MKTSVFGVTMIQKFESCVLTAYPDSRKIPTIGWGHTGNDVQLSPRPTIWTQAQADAQLAADISWRGEKPINDHVIAPLTQGQFDALVSLIFNIGGGAFAGSTLLKKLNDHDYAGAGQEFVQWKKAGDHPDELLRRRAQEMWLFARSTL